MGSIKIFSGQLTIETVEITEVLNLHDTLSSHPDIVELSEPIYPRGIKNMSALESAVSRQFGGSGDYYEYSNQYSNCATLLYGITKNHSFHNGNKRAGFLSMLLHLYKNGKVLAQDVKHDEIYQVLKKLADTEENFEKFVSIKYRKLYNVVKKKYPEFEDRAATYFLELWLKKISISKNQLSKALKWNNFFNKLRQCNLEPDINYSNQTFSVTKKVETKIFRIFSDTKEITITYPYKGKMCSPYIISKVRNDFKLNKSDGIDNTIFFYEQEIFIDEVLTQYKKLIYRLSLT